MNNIDLYGRVPQWIRRRTSDPKIAGSNLVMLEIFADPGGTLVMCSPMGLRVADTNPAQTAGY